MSVTRKLCLPVFGFFTPFNCMQDVASLKLVIKRVVTHQSLHVCAQGSTVQGGVKVGRSLGGIDGETSEHLLRFLSSELVCWLLFRFVELGLGGVHWRQFLVTFGFSNNDLPNICEGSSVGNRWWSLCDRCPVAVAFYL